MGQGSQFAFESAEQIWNEVRSVWPAGRGITYQRLENGGLQWPCLSEDHPGTQVLHTQRSGEKPVLRCNEFVPTSERTDDAFPLALITGRTLYQFNAGTMTQRTPNTLLRADDYLDVSPADAQRLGIADGARVSVESHYGHTALTARISQMVKPGEVFATFHNPESNVNALTGDQRDRQTDTPEYKMTAVRVSPVIARETSSASDLRPLRSEPCKQRSSETS
jgi:formate dehydrogenase major subunit